MRIFSLGLVLALLATAAFADQSGTDISGQQAKQVTWLNISLVDIDFGWEVHVKDSTPKWTPVGVFADKKNLYLQFWTPELARKVKLTASDGTPLSGFHPEGSWVICNSIKDVTISMPGDGDVVTVEKPQD